MRKLTPPRRAPEGSDGADAKYHSKILGKALDLLHLLKTTPEPLSLGALTKELGLAKSSIFRILHTLEGGGYVEKDAAGCYELSPDIRPLVPACVIRDLRGVALPRMSDLQRRVPETVSLGVLFDNHVEVVAVLESPQRIRMGNTVGRILPPHASSLGKVLTAHQSEGRRRRVLESYGLHSFTPKTIVDAGRLEEELKRIVEQGHAADEEENTLDGCCLGVPIRGGDHVVAGMSVSMPKSRFPTGDERARLLGLLIDTAARIAAGLIR